MKFTWRTEWPLWLLLALMFLIAAITWVHAPDRVPTHWGANGEVNGYGGKFEGILLVPLVAVVIYLLFLLLPKIDPARENYARFAGAYPTLRFTVLLFLTLVSFVVHLAIRGHRVPIETLIPVFVGGMFLVLGGVLRRVHPNWFVGIRTPWTLSSKRAWTKTHQVGGWVFSAGGVLLIVAGILHSSTAMIAMIVLVGAGMLGTVVYSYIVWRDDPDRISPAGPFRGD